MMNTKEQLRKENKLLFCFPYDKGLSKQDFKLLAVFEGKDMTELLGELVLNYAQSQKGLLKKSS